MLFSVEGCLSPSSFFVASITCSSSCSASLHRPPSFIANPSIAILLTVCICFSPKRFVLISKDNNDMFSASPARPCLHAYHAALYNNRLHSLSESSPSGRCANDDFTCGKSTRHLPQFSY